MADSGHPPAELHERLLICRTIKLNAGAHGGHRRCCHAQMQKNAQNKPQIARLILCVHTTLQVYCNLFLTFCGVRLGRVRFTQRAAKDRIELVGARAKPLPTAVEFRWFYRAGEIIAPLDRRSRRLRWSCTPRRRWWSAGLPSREQDRRPCPVPDCRRGQKCRDSAPD